MSNEFQQKLKLYKEGKLNQDEMLKIESEINKFVAISDYLNDDEKEFLEELKQQIPSDIRKENKFAQLLKRKINLRIILLTALSSFIVLVIFIFMYFTASRITTSLFALDHNEIYAKREAMVQLAQMLQPQYKSYESSVNSSLFAQQNIRVSLEKNVGNTNIDKTEISIKYSFGKPVRSAKSAVRPLVLDILSYTTSHESTSLSGFKVLEDAPQGTKAKLFVEFNKPLTAQEIKEQFIDIIGNTDAVSLDLTPIAVIGSEFVLANPSYYQIRTVFPYGSNIAKLVEDNDFKQTQYENMDNQAHKESLVGNLNLIKNNLRLLQVAYYDAMFENVNFDDMIKQVESKGAQYVGMYISADSKDLLKLKSNPHIHCVEVENIVIW